MTTFGYKKRSSILRKLTQSGDTPDKICLEYELKYVLYYFEILEMKINLEARKNLERSVSSDKNTYKII